MNDGSATAFEERAPRRAHHILLMILLYEKPCTINSFKRAPHAKPTAGWRSEYTRADFLDDRGNPSAENDMKVFRSWLDI